ncbi:hypothetical protein H4Q26_002325 [Puccinia striiformis f. sp. tritici PST-130]|nr:hypothetical protein H4Q26_002325 [Puccinia striiformis f. sp. tritici PST-130]
MCMKVTSLDLDLRPTKLDKQSREFTIDENEATSNIFYPVSRLTKLTSLALTAPKIKSKLFNEDFIVRLIRDIVGGVTHVVGSVYPQTVEIHHGRWNNKRTRTGNRKAPAPREPSTQTDPQDSDSGSSHHESDIAVVPTNTSPIVANTDEASTAITNTRPNLATPTATPTASQPSNSEDTQRKTTSDIWAHFLQSGKGMPSSSLFF